MKTIVGTTFCNVSHGDAGVWKQELSMYWEDNALRCFPDCERLIVSVASSEPRVAWLSTKLVLLDGNIGYISELLRGEKPYPLSGWGVQFAALAMLAYCDEANLVFQEQDCLAFGPWLEEFERLSEGERIVIGHVEPNAEQLSTCFFYVPHAAILPLVAWYLTSEPERIPDRIIERKFWRLWQSHPEKFSIHLRGYDRRRPFDVNDELFYVQQVTRDEVKALRARGLLD